MNVNFNRHMCPQETVQVWRRKEISKREIITQGTQCYGGRGRRWVKHHVLSNASHPITRCSNILWLWESKEQGQVQGIVLGLEFL